MRPLELKVFPRLKRPRYGYGIDPYREQWKRERKVILSKRFTDSDLAAEYWAAYSIYVREASNLLHCQERYMEAAGKSFQEEQRKCAILHRFATLPNYDEES